MGPDGGDGGERTRHQWVAPDAPAEAASPSPTGVPGPPAPADPGRPPAGSSRPPQGATAVPVPAPLMPLRVLDMLDASVRVLRQRPRPILAFTALAFVPIQLAAAYLARGQWDEAFEVGANVSAGAAFSDATSGWGDLAIMYAAVLPLPFLGAFMALMVTDWYGGVDAPTGDLVRRTLARVPALAVAWVATHLAITVAVVLLVLPALFVVPLFLLVAPVIAVEGLGPFAGLRRAVRLAGRRYWSCFWVVVASAVVGGALELSLSALPSVVAGMLGPDLGWILLAVGGALAALVAAPVVVGAAVMAYLDARVRTEGLDIEMRAAEVLEGTGR
jgi:hypothetical protein